MDGTTLALVAGLVVSFLAAVFGWVRWLHELGEKRRERAARQDAEAKLALMRRRSLAECPYFSLYDELPDMLILPKDGTGEVNAILDGSPHLLSCSRNEVGPEVEEGDPVLLLIENNGQRAQEVSVTLDNKPIEFMHVEEHSTGQRIPVFSYPYRLEMLGREQTLTVSFLSVSGARDTHRYLTKHGVRFLRRIDPA